MSNVKSWSDNKHWSLWMKTSIFWTSSRRYHKPIKWGGGESSLRSSISFPAGPDGNMRISHFRGGWGAYVRCMQSSSLSRSIVGILACLVNNEHITLYLPFTSLTLGVKCRQCSHTGKANIFPQMKLRASQHRRHKVDVFDQATFLENVDVQNLTCELRHTIFGGSHRTLEGIFDVWYNCWLLDVQLGYHVFQRIYHVTANTLHLLIIGIDNISRHVIGYLGDLPVASARWRVEHAHEQGRS